MTERTCSIDGCGKPHEARGWCRLHYDRWRATGDPFGIRRKRKYALICSIEDCEGAMFSRGWCQRHYTLWSRYGDPLATPNRHRRFCATDDCGEPAHGHGLCETHYRRMQRRGTVELKGRNTGADHHKWRGDNAAYADVHKRVRKLRGPARRYECASCGGVAAHWAYDHLDPNERRSPGGQPYSTDLTRYRPMCAKCHKRFDVANSRKLKETN